MFKATEGNGGAPIILSREPIEKPEIPRGEIWIEARGGFVTVDQISESAEADTVTFSNDIDGYRVTYHDVQVIGMSPTFGLQAFVGPHDVVTWERISG